MRALLALCLLSAADGGPGPAARPERATGENSKLDAKARRSILKMDGGLAAFAVLPDGGRRFHLLPVDLDGENVELDGDFPPYVPPYIQGNTEEDPKLR
jgi:hypothetical protein